MLAAARLATAGFCVALLVSAPAARADDAPLPPPIPPPVLDPIGGFPDGIFLRTRDGEIVLFPGGRLQVDGAFFPRQIPKSGVFIRRARVELAGWFGSSLYFDVSGDFAPAPPAGTDVAPSALGAADDYVAWAPLGDRAIVQAGEFDAPFTLENRTSDAYTDFIERAMTARSLGAPLNKEVGVMVHGLVGDGRFYYSGGLFNGEGPEFRNLDNQSDSIGRLVLTPFATGERPWRRLSIGASAWYGNHVLGPEVPVQATPGGMVFFEPHWTTGPATPFELHEQGTSTAFGGELNLPIGGRFGLRAEVVWRRQHLVESATTAGPSAPTGDALLDGFAAYGEIWFWLWGDDRLLPAPGLELPLRVDAAGGETGPLYVEGLQLAVRGELLTENLTSDNVTLGDPGISTTRVTTGTIGVNYWRGRFVRLSANYVVNEWSGTSITIMALATQQKIEQEFLLRFAISL
ncbi:MAG TPA: porin [Polyangia bacterium]|nr:porin [Polyangia bacterium]